MIILKNYTPEQYYELARNKIIADGVGLTNFNEGSNVRALLEAVGLIASQLGFDYLEGIRRSIPIALYTGLGFEKKAAQPSSGFLRFYRLPVFYIRYDGLDTNVTLTITPLQLVLDTSGTPGDDLTLDFATYPTVADLVAAINAHINWTAVEVSSGAVTDLYQYSAKQIIGNTNYLTLTNAVDIMTIAAAAVSIPTGVQASRDNVLIQTTASGTIPAGDATSAPIAAKSTVAGSLTNIDARAINTIVGDGVLTTPISGVEHVINDSAFANGMDEESDEERAVRFQDYIQGLHGGTRRGIEREILKIPEIKSVTLIERDPVPGTNTVVADDGTGSLTLDMIAKIRKVIEGDPDDIVNYPGAGVAGINYNIEPPTMKPVPVTATIYRIGTTSDADEIVLKTKSVIERYINTRRLGDDCVISELVKRAKSAHPAIYDFVLSTPTANVSSEAREVLRVGAGTGAVVTLNIVTLDAIP